MAKNDFWWDGAEAYQPVAFDSLLDQVLKRRPALDVPTIAIVGNALRFRGSALHKIAHRTGLLRTVDFDELPDDRIRSPGVALLRWSPFDGHTTADRLRARIPQDVRVLNDTGLDTGKHNVEAHFAAAAGYGTAVDAATGSGFAVVKSGTNGRHDGRVVRLPLPGLDPLSVCQKLIDNSLGDHIFDLRIPFVLGNPVFAYVKFRERSRRFENANASVKLVTPADVLTDQEIAVCQRLCQSIGLQYGELDILRDGDRGRIHVVDVNNTPAGPPAGLAPTDRMAAMRMIAVAFRRHVFDLPC
ncbi:MAG: hypothetical protein JWR80_2340 [Bradyrhizobium sp.]|nr:hypothetical protein [Bradyrhizobium sp.]